MTFEPNLTQRMQAAVKRRVVHDWRSRLKDYSTIALAMSAAIVALWSTLPADWLQHLPTAWVARGTGILSMLGLVGKFVHQGHVPAKD
jgi:purine-cytosine permease-like protein